MGKKTSLKDIANKVGVSIPLVSYVLSNKGKENRVSETTAEKIRKVAKELNYHPNLNARSLKTNKTRTIGVIVADISNAFFSNIARIIEDEAYSQDYTVIFGSSDENVEKFDKVLNFLITRQVDGLIIAAPQGSKKSILKLKELGLPFVLIDRYFKSIDANYVVLDNFNASIQATNYLLSKGHKKVASVMYNSKLAHYRDRRDGYLEALKQAGIEKNDNWIAKINHLDLSNDMNEALKQLVLGEKVDAIYFQTNTLAEEGLRQLISLGRDKLNHIDIIVFDQNSAYQFLEVPIPYMVQPLKEIGQKALRMLIELIEDKTEEETTGLSLKAKLEMKAFNK